MIRREDMKEEVWQAMCTPMNLVLAANPRSGSGSLYLGSWMASVDTELLQSHKITHIVQVLDVPWAQQGAAPGFVHYQIKILDSSTAELRPHLEAACKHIRDALARGKNVLVHCQQGISRSAAVVIAYLIRQHNMTYDSAYKLVKAKRMCIKPNPGFEKTLRDWERDLRTAGVLSRTQSTSG
ncbi:phosphatases II [Rickenella mellea]|uniref:protein-tyrosine-phosphatase n=1 Tax=Rickenella mellea TaxID=50990 RepID=A0A4Y7PUS2_9AGAM|nr:phosphatases II [Rickenella mellea]